MIDEEFVSFFIAPNMTWMHAYEDMIERRELGHDQRAKNLVYYIEQRLKYEIMLEFGLTGRIGRTLEKSSCSVMSFLPEDISIIAKAVQERTVNELGTLTTESNVPFERMVLGFLNQMRLSGAFADHVFDEYTSSGNGYMLSNDRNCWLPGRQSGRNTPRFIAESLVGARKTYEFDSVATSKYVDRIEAFIPIMPADRSICAQIGKLILEEGVKQKVLTTVPSSPEYRIYALNKARVFITDRVIQMRCEQCGSPSWADAGQVRTMLKVQMVYSNMDH